MGALLLSVVVVAVVIIMITVISTASYPAADGANIALLNNDNMANTTIYAKQNYTYAKQNYTYAKQNYTYAKQNYTYAKQNYTYAKQNYMLQHEAESKICLCLSVCLSAALSLSAYLSLSLCVSLSLCMIKLALKDVVVVFLLLVLFLWHSIQFSNWNLITIHISAITSSLPDRKLNDPSSF